MDKGWLKLQRLVDDPGRIRDKLEYDLYYAKHCSFWLDMLICLRTFRTLITGDGAR